MKVYLISGESYLLINEQIGTIVGSSKNITTFDFNTSSIEDVLIEAGYVSMFQETKFIIVKNANFFGTGKIKDKELETLEKFLDNTSFNVVLIFVINEKPDMRKKITKLIKERYTLIIVANLKPYEIQGRVMSYFQKKGLDIDKNSVNYIVENSLNNYDVVMNELEKIVLYYNESNHIKYDDVTNIVAKSINTNNFLFVDALVDNNLPRCLELLDDLKAMKVEPTIILALIARDFRIMLNIKNLQNANKSEYDIMNTLGLADWQLTKYLKKVFPYKIKELEEILIKLSKLDLDIKTGKIDKYISLELLILDLCG